MPIANTLAFNNSGGGSNPLDPAKYQGLYDASTNTPTLVNGVGTDGYWYLTSVAGNNTPGGVSLAVDQVLIYVELTGLWTASVILSNNTDNIIVGVNYAPVNDIVADGEVLSYALGALQYQATLAATNIATAQGDITDLQADKQDLITGATNGNLAGMDGTGQTTNTGVAIATTVTNTDATVPTSKAVQTYVTSTNPMNTLGDLIIGGASGAPTRLPGNTTATPRFLKSLGNGTTATAETWTQVDYADLSGTPPAADGIAPYDPGTTYNAGEYSTYIGAIWFCIANAFNQAPSTSSAYWKWISDFNFTKYAEVTIIQGNDIAAATGGAPFETIMAALSYIGSFGWVNIVDYRQTYPEDLIINSATNVFIAANSANIQGGAIVKSLTVTGTAGNISTANTEYTNSSDAPALTISSSVGNVYTNNCRFNISASAPTSPSILFTGSWAGNTYFNNCTASNKDIVIGGTPVGTVNVYFTNWSAAAVGNAINLTLTCNANVYIYNCESVNIVSWTAGKIYLDGVYLSNLDRSANASSNNFLSIRNTSMRNPTTGAYGTMTGNGTAAYQFTDFDYDRSTYTFAGAAQFDITSGPGIDWVQQTYKQDEVVNEGGALWANQAATTTQVPSIASTDWLQISNLITQKMVLIDSMLGNDNKINTNIFATAQAAINSIGNTGIARINNFRGTYAETVDQTANYQLLSGIADLPYTQNATLQGIVCKASFSNFQTANLALFGQSGALALEIESNNAGGNVFIANQFGNDTPGSNSIELDSGWDGSNTFYNGNYNSENNVVINDANSTEAQVVFVNSSGGVNLDINTRGIVKVIGNSTGTAVTENVLFASVGDSTIITSTNASDWTLRQYAPVQNNNAITVNSSGLFIAVSTNGLIRRSPDGTTWTGIISGTTANLSGVAVNSSGLFVTVGASGTILTSSDSGVTWTSRTSGTTNNLLSIKVNSADVFVATGLLGTILTSSNGTTWTSRTSGVVVNLNSVAVSSTNLFVTVGNTGTILTSSDSGITWTSRTSGTTNNLNSVGVNSSGLFVVGGGGGVIRTSPDGTTWTSRTSGTSSTLLSVVVNASGLFVVSGASGTILTSPNGTTWTSRTSGSTSSLNGSTINSSGLFVIVGSNNTILSSPDGTTWTTVATGTTNLLRGIVIYNDMYITVGVGGRIYYSTDQGDTWAAAISGTALQFNGITVNSSGLFVAIGATGLIASSPDGINWTVQTSGTTANLNGVAVNSSGLFVTVGGGGFIFTSPDAITWTPRTSNASQALVGIGINSSDLFVAVGNGGGIVTSPDGINWTARTSGFGNVLQGVAVNSAGLFVVVGVLGAILTSPDGTNWTTRTSGTTANLSGVAVSSGGLFVTVGATGVILSSPNGTTWSAGLSGTANNLFGIAVDSTGQFIVVGDTGIVLKSNNAFIWSESVISGTSFYYSLCINENTGIFLATGDGGIILTSSNYSTWTNRTSGVTVPLYGCGVNSNNVFAVVGATGTILTSSDSGITWTSRTSGTTNNLYGIIATNNGVFVAVGVGGIILTSSNDGTSWTSRTSGTTNNLRGITVTTTNNVIVTGLDGTILTSSNDGTSWTVQTSGTTVDLYCVKANTSNLVVIGGFGGITLTSTNLTAWTIGSIGAAQTISSIVCTLNNTFYASTLIGAIFTTPDGITWTSSQATPGSTALTALAVYQNYFVNDTPYINIMNFAAGRLILENAYIKNFVNNAPSSIYNRLFMNNCSFYDPSTQTYATISGTGTVETILENVNYDRNAYTFPGLIPNGDTIAGIPVNSVSGLPAATNAEALTGTSAAVALTPANATYMTYASTTKAFASLYAFTGVDVTLPAVAILNNGNSTFRSITISQRALTFTLGRAAVYQVNGRFTVTSTGSGNTIGITPTVSAGATVMMTDINLSNASSGTTTRVNFSGTVTVSSGTPTLSFELTTLTGGYTVGDTDNPSYLVVAEL